MNHVKRLVAILLAAMVAGAAAAQSEAAWVEEKTYFSEGLCAFIDPDSGLTGYIDTTGKVAIPPRFQRGRPFSEGFAVVLAPGADPDDGPVYHYIDKTGAIVKSIAPYHEAQGFSDGLAQITQYTGKSAIVYYLDAKFEYQFGLPYECEFGGSFSEGLAWASVGDIFSSQPMRYGYIDKKGELVIPAEYSDASAFDGGIALVSRGGTSGGYTDDGSRIEPTPGDWLIIDSKGRILREIAREIAGESGQSLKYPRDGVIIHRSAEGLVRAYGAGGALLFETRAYEHVFPFSDGLALAIRREPSLEGKDPMPYSYGYLDKTGKVAIPFTTPLGLYSRFGSGLYAYFDFDSGLIGFKDRAGKIVIKPLLSPAIAEEEEGGFY